MGQRNQIEVTGDGNVISDNAVGAGAAVNKGPNASQSGPNKESIRGRIFISHAHTDEPLVQELVDLLLLGADIRRDSIFASSLAGHAIPAGETYLSYLQTTLREAVLVILVITRDYLNSAFCTAELGALWALGTPSVPLLVPPADLGELDGLLSSLQVGNITEPSSLDQLRDRVLESVQGRTDLAGWERRRDRFIASLRG